MSDSSNKHLNFAAPCFKPSANSSFRIDDILVKSDAIGKRSFADLKRLEQNEESGDSGLKKAKKATEQQTSDAPETSHGSSASLLSTLSSFYDMHSYHPGVSMLMKNSSTFQSLYNGLNLDNTSAVKAALALSSSFNSLALLSNPTGNGLNEFSNGKLGALELGAVNKPEVKSSIKLCRRRKARTVFSDQQLSGLEKRFESQKYLSTPERVELATSLGLSETQVSLIFNWENLIRRRRRKTHINYLWLRFNLEESN